MRGTWELSIGATGCLFVCNQLDSSACPLDESWPATSPSTMEQLERVHLPPQMNPAAVFSAAVPAPAPITRQLRSVLIHKHQNLRPGIAHGRRAWHKQSARSRGAQLNRDRGAALVAHPCHPN